jgi:flagellar motor switch protein FliN/FliY
MADDIPEVVETELAKAAEAVGDATEATSAIARGSPARTIDFIMDVVLHVTVEVGRARMTIQDLLQLGQGSVIELEKLAGESLDVYVNGKHVARGEAVIVNEKFGVRILEIISPEARIQSLG